MLRFFPNPREERETEQETRKIAEILDPSYEVDGSWKPIKVKTEVPKKLLFVDGVRRTEYRTTIFDDDQFLGEAIFISIGAGALEVDFTGRGPHYNVLFPTIERYFIYSISRAVEIPPYWETSIGNYTLRFKSLMAFGRDLGKTANLQMGKLEVRVSQKVLTDNHFLLMDGPVKKNLYQENVAYLVKDQKNIYLQGKEEIIFKLQKGYRTPIFLFEEFVGGLTKEGKYKTKKVKKLASYVCLADRVGLNDPTLSLLRIELPFTKDVKKAVETVEKAAAAALMFANKPLRDFRAPQNLTTIAFLEKELRRYLGEYKLIRRQIGKIVFISASKGGG